MWNRYFNKKKFPHLFILFIILENPFPIFFLHKIILKRLYYKNIFLANIHSPNIFCGVIHIYYILSVTVVLIWIFSVFLCIWNIFSFKIFAQFQFELRWNIIWFAVEKLNGCKCTEFKYCVHLAIELISFFLNRVLNYVLHKMQTFQCIKWLIFFQGKYFNDIICKIDFLRKKTTYIKKQIINANNPAHTQYI